METRIPEQTPFDTNFLGETSLETKYSFFHTPISWSAIFAGLVTALAVSICLSFLIAALGLSQMDFTSSSPFRGSFLSTGIGSLIVMVISLASGSFVAGRFAEISGALHGFLTWALITLLMTLQAIHVVSHAANLSAKAVGKSTSMIEQTVDNLSSLLAKLNSENFEKFFATKNDNGINFDKLGHELRTLLKKSDIPALNPDRLKQTYQAALNDIGSAITAFKNDPSHYRSTLKNLGNSLSNRLETLTTKVNQSDIIKALMNNGMSRTDAQTTATNAVQLYQRAEEKTEQTLKALEKQADTLSQKLDVRAKDALHMADKATTKAAHMGWWGFLGCLIGAIISSVCGYYGYRSRKNIFRL
ncbi:TIGR04086 family membrane protein [Bartonella krasnovii]|uniref:TIGR04086 family membrane protein n=1 Tax=Bartonella krasnovii TaxID=2267275 RepID=UPI001F4D2211|nr:TIGR04086 family membrane protein [Bartonella krasnovii]UNF41743.1 TIGR04086 family membrane protein [Bartonella krasnovii]UNF54947.1 TIGR04086 family membrane protein [Bartonella krasnovii]